MASSAFFLGNAAEDLKVDAPKNPRYLMVTGMADSTGWARCRPRVGLSSMWPKSIAARSAPSPFAGRPPPTPAASRIPKPLRSWTRSRCARQLAARPITAGAARIEQRPCRSPSTTNLARSARGSRRRVARRAGSERQTGRRGGQSPVGAPAALAQHPWLRATSWKS